MIMKKNKLSITITTLILMIAYILTTIMSVEEEVYIGEGIIVDIKYKKWNVNLVRLLRDKQIHKTPYINELWIYTIRIGNKIITTEVYRKSTLKIGDIVKVYFRSGMYVIKNP